MPWKRVAPSQAATFLLQLPIDLRIFRVSRLCARRTQGKHEMHPEDPHFASPASSLEAGILEAEQGQDANPLEEEDDSEGPSGVTAEEFEQLLVAPIDWSVSTIHEILDTQVILNPEFQRRSVWNGTKKSRFIESLMLGIPIPQILLTPTSPRPRSPLWVLDGKQRLLALKEFFGSEGKRGFRLSNLSILTELNGKRWTQIREDEKYSNILLGAAIRTTIIRGWRDSRVLFEIFNRLNSGSVPLSPMELRMSLMPGPFLTWALRYTEEQRSLHRLLTARGAISGGQSRMGDVEILIRFVAFNQGRFTYKGNLRAFLDECCEWNNSNFDKGAIEQIANSLELGIDEGFREFGDKFCKKYIGATDGAFDYETRFNRAIFDVLIGSFCREDIRVWAGANRGELKAAYEELSRESSTFNIAVSDTTKTPRNVRARFSSWYDKVYARTGIRIEIPKIVEV